MFSEEVERQLGDPLLTLEDAGLCRSMRVIDAVELVETAAMCLADGVDSPSLRRLAGCTQIEALYAVADLWPSVCSEFDLNAAEDMNDQRRAIALTRRALRIGSSPRQITELFNAYFEWNVSDLIDEIRNIEYVYRDLSLMTWSRNSLKDSTALDREVIGKLEQLLQR